MFPTMLMLSNRLTWVSWQTLNFGTSFTWHQPTVALLLSQHELLQPGRLSSASPAPWFCVPISVAAVPACYSPVLSNLSTVISSWSCLDSIFSQNHSSLIPSFSLKSCPDTVYVRGLKFILKYWSCALSQLSATHKLHQQRELNTRRWVPEIKTWS